MEHRKAKVAFMFLGRRRIPFTPLWERFFGGHDGLFSIYIHTSPDFREEPSKVSCDCLIFAKEHFSTERILIPLFKLRIKSTRGDKRF